MPTGAHVEGLWARKSRRAPQLANLLGKELILYSANQLATELICLSLWSRERIQRSISWLVSWIASAT